MSKLTLNDLIINFEPKYAVYHHIDMILKKEFPGKFICSMIYSTESFSLKNKFREFCELTILFEEQDGLASFIEIHYKKETKALIQSIKKKYYQKWLKAVYKNNVYHLIHLQNQEGDLVLWTVAESEEAFNFLLNEWSEYTKIHIPDDIRILENGSIYCNQNLRTMIRSSSFEDLCFDSTFIEKIKNELKEFIESRELYAKYNLPWKRGIIFIGPPWQWENTPH